MKKNILFLAIAVLFLIFGTKKTYCCGPMNFLGDVIYDSIGVVSIPGQDRTIYMYTIYPGTEQKMRLKCHIDIHPYSYVDISYNNPQGTSEMVAHFTGFAREVVETGLIDADGYWMIYYNPQYSSSGAYPGIEIEFGPATEEEPYSMATIDSMMLKVPERLGIGLSENTAPVTRLHIFEEAIMSGSGNDYGQLTRFQGRALGVGGIKNIYVDDFFTHDASTPAYIRGVSINTTDTSSSTLSSWIKQNPEQKSISFGDGANTYMTIKEGNVGIGVAPSSSYNLYVNGITRMNGNVGIGGTPSSTYKLYVNGPTCMYGNVGIGIAPSLTPSEKLVLNGTIKADTVKATTVITNSNMGNQTINDLIVNGTSKLTGNVGIGTAPTANKLEVNGTAKATNLRISGNVGIGTTHTLTEKLEVNGKIRTKEVIIDPDDWSDFVLAPNYKAPELQTVEEFIQTHGHLPNMPSEAEVMKNGVGLGEMNVRLLQTVEEMMLYIIEQNKRIEQLNEKVNNLQPKSRKNKAERITRKKTRQ